MIGWRFLQKPLQINRYLFRESIQAMKKICLVGAGLLGSAIGARLLTKGVELVTWNRTANRCQSLIDLGAKPIKTLKGVAQDCDAVITVLRDGPVTKKVISELGDLNSKCVIPMGTMGIGEIRNLDHQIRNQNGSCLEAPVLGSKPQAISGTLLVMAGGDPELFEQQRPLLSHLSEAPMLVGPIGSGAATKLALNQLIASSMPFAVVKAGATSRCFGGNLHGHSAAICPLRPHLRQETAADAGGALHRSELQHRSTSKRSTAVP